MSKKIPEDQNAEAGSVIFYILIAIALFAALSFAVSNMMRGAPSDIGKEKAAIYADEILDYAAGIRKAVQMIRVSNDCADTDISFANSFVAGYEHTPVADDGCKVFHGDGGGMSYVEPLAAVLDSSFSANGNYRNLVFSGNNCVEALPDGDISTCYSDGLDNEELILFYPFIKKSICLAINEKLGISNPSDDAPVDSGCAFGGAKFSGSYTETYSLGSSSGELDGKSVGCFRHNSGCAPIPNSYNFYQVLIAR